MTQIDEWLRQADAYNDQDEPDEAAEIASRVLTLEPDNYKALFLIGSVMLKCGRNTQAQQFLRRVCEIKPRDHRGWAQLSISSAEMHRYDEAIEFAEKALTFKRDSRTLANASFAHTTAGNWQRGRFYALESLKLEPGFKDAVFHLANCDLAQRNWIDGWAGFKVTEGGKWRKKWTYGESQEWGGEPDAVVMVTGEQGIGDEVLASSVIPSAIKACKQFIFDCDARNAALFARSFPDALVVPTRDKQAVALPVAPTHHKTLFGLLSLFRQHDADFPQTAFLKPNPAYVAMFKELLGSFGRRRVVGLGWSGGHPRTGLTERTAGVRAFLPLMRMEPEALYVSLQYKDDAAEVIAFEQDTKAHVVRLPWVTQGQDMDVLAGLIAACDEVIGVATAALHYSSAMGIPTTWLCNRGLIWTFAGDQLLWYPPTAQIWRKDKAESWAQCINSLAQHRKDERRAAA